MPRPYPREFRDVVVRVARNREEGVTIEQIATDFGVHPMTLTKWMRQADIDEGAKPGKSTGDSAELVELRRRNRLLEQENEVLRRAAATCRRPICREKGLPARKGARRRWDPRRGDVPGTAARPPAYYRWLANPITDAELVEAYRANALFDAHRDDPEFGYRYLVEEARDAGEPMAERTGWRICSQNRLWSVFGKKRGKNGKAGPPVHDDLVERDFTAEAPNRLWLSDITEHSTGEGKLYICAIKDAFSNRIVGYSIDSRMKSRLATTALDSAVARRGDTAGCILHSDRGSQFRSRKFVHALNRHGMVGSIGRVGAAGDNAAMESFFSLLQKNVLDLFSAAEERAGPAPLGHPRTAPHRDPHLDRTDLPPAAPTNRSRPVDPD